jgi:hypothetical protein
MMIFAIDGSGAITVADAPVIETPDSLMDTVTATDAGGWGCGTTLTIKIPPNGLFAPDGLFADGFEDGFEDGFKDGFKDGLMQRAGRKGESGRGRSPVDGGPRSSDNRSLSFYRRCDHR